MTQEVAVAERRAVAARADSGDTLLLAAIKTGDIQFAKSIIEMRDHERKQNALIAFNNAFADAKAEIPVIMKNRNVRFESKGKSGEYVDYDHEDIAGIAEVIDPILGKNGLTYRWELGELDGGRFEVTCILAHRDGHSVQTKSSGARDTSGAKNDFQGRSSAETYLKRATLKAICGIAIGERDDDGRAAGNLGGAAPQYISAAQLAELIALADELNVDKAIFCGLPTIKAESLAHIAAKDFDHAKATMELKRGRKGSR
jgi:hypothetical protein